MNSSRKGNALINDNLMYISCSDSFQSANLLRKVLTEKIQCPEKDPGHSGLPERGRKTDLDREALGQETEKDIFNYSSFF